MCCVKAKHSLGHMSGMVGPMDVKRKGSAPVEYWVYYVTSTFYLTHDLDWGCFKVKFRNSSISEIAWLMWNEKEANYKILGQPCDFALWPHPWSWLSSFKVKVWNSLISGIGSPVDMEWKGYKSFVRDHDIDFCVTMVGCVDVPDSDPGDFRRRRAVDISSWTLGDLNEISEQIFSN